MIDRNLIRVLACCCAGIVSLSISPSVSRAEDSFSPEQIAFFESKIRPLLIKRCGDCHIDDREGGLSLTSRASLLRGGDTGPAVVPGKPDAGELLAAIGYEPDGYQMPPDGKLPDEEIALLTKWVKMGAPWPEATDAAAQVDDEFNLEERADWWSFQPLNDPASPSVKNADWCRNPIDRFVLAKLEEAGLTPAPPADPNLWLRRAAFDVTGLPPTSEQVAQFVANESPDAVTAAADRLLASPHYGERWGRHWLDLMRYAESRGHEFDFDVPNAWQYRDYVIRALNADVAYDQFVVEHVAGDLLKPADDDTAHPEYHLRLRPDGANESILATGFWFLGEWVHSPVDIRQDEADRFDNMIDTYSRAFLGLTVACARCHDHKFDPISTKDYYALAGYLQSSDYRQARFETMEHNRRVREELDELRWETNRRVAAELLSLLSAVGSLDQYLLAANEIIRDPGADPEAVAAERELDAELVAEWVAHLRQAADDADDPFYYWARLAMGELESVAEANRLMELQLQPWKSDQEREPSPAQWFSPEELVADGVGFVREGDEYFTLSAETDSPPIGYAGDSLLRFDPELAAIKTPAGTQADPGGLEAWKRSGRTLKTPTFELERAKVFVRIRGGCNTYVVVDSHALIKGPLHGSVLHQHPAPKDDGGNWRWVEHDVSRYAGHRVHVAVVARPDEPLEVSDVVHADRAPFLKSVPPAYVREQSAPQEVPTTLQELAENYAFEFSTVGRILWDIKDGLPTGLSWRTDELQWVLQHPSLFGLSTAEAEERLRDIADRFHTERSRLLAELEKASALAPAMWDGPGEDEYVFIRGNWKKPGETVPRRFLEVFPHRELEEPDAAQEPVGLLGTVDDLPAPTNPRSMGSGRLHLATQMVDPQQTPILPRVIVNRIWQHYFGRGLVDSPDDFGRMGQQSSHPELLDWLANELAAHDWSLKHIHRLILTSATYRMSSDVQHTATEQSDPENRLLHRMNVKRLEGEVLRDAVLAVSGRLNPQMSGPSVPVYLTPFMEGRGKPQSGPLDSNGRRSVYISVRRNFLNPFFTAFDFPNPAVANGRRTVSNVPAQALAMLNNPLIVQQAERWSQQTAGMPTGERIEAMYVEAFSRPPTEEERQQAEAAIAESGADAAAWSAFAHVLLNVKEFFFVR